MITSTLNQLKQVDHAAKERMRILKQLNYWVRVANKNPSPAIYQLNTLVADLYELERSHAPVDNVDEKLEFLIIEMDAITRELIKLRAEREAVI